MLGKNRLAAMKKNVAMNVTVALVASLTVSAGVVALAAANSTDSGISGTFTGSVQLNSGSPRNFDMTIEGVGTGLGFPDAKPFRLVVNDGPLATDFEASPGGETLYESTDFTFDLYGGVGYSTVVTRGRGLWRIVGTSAPSGAGLVLQAALTSDRTLCGSSCATTNLAINLDGAAVNAVGCSASRCFTVTGDYHHPGFDPVKFVYVPATQHYRVPPNVTQLEVQLVGAGQYGGIVTATMPVIPGELLNVRVGGAANGQLGGYNGGANGGLSKPHTSPVNTDRPLAPPNHADWAQGGNGASDITRGPFYQYGVIAGGAGGCRPHACDTNDPTRRFGGRPYTSPLPCSDNLGDEGGSGPVENALHGGGGGGGGACGGSGGVATALGNDTSVDGEGGTSYAEHAVQDAVMVPGAWGGGNGSVTIQPIFKTEKAANNPLEFQVLHSPPLLVSKTSTTFRFDVVCPPNDVVEVDGQSMPDCAPTGTLVLVPHKQATTGTGLSPVITSLTPCNADDPQALCATINLTGQPDDCVSYYAVVSDGPRLSVSYPGAGAYAPQLLCFSSTSPVAVSHSFGSTTTPSATPVSGPWGSGLNQFGLDTGEEQATTGPAAFEVLPGGTVVVLDQVNSRIAVFPATEAPTTMSAPLSGDLGDIVADPERERYYVLDAGGTKWQVPHVLAIAFDGTLLADVPLGQLWADAIRLGPGGVPYVHAHPNDMWMPVFASLDDLEPLSPQAQQMSATSGIPTDPAGDATGNAQLVVRARPTDIRVAVTNGYLTTRKWTVTNNGNANFGEVQLAKIVDGKLLLVVRRYTNTDAEYQVITMLDEDTVESVFSVTAPQYADANPLSSFRLSADGRSLYEMRTSTSGLDVVKFSLGGTGTGGPPPPPGGTYSNQCDGAGETVVHQGWVGDNGHPEQTWVKVKTRSPSAGVTYLCYRVDNAAANLHEGGRIAIGEGGGSANLPVVDSNSAYCASRPGNVTEADITLVGNTYVRVDRSNPVATTSEAFVCVRLNNTRLRVSTPIPPSAGGAPVDFDEDA